MRACGAIRRTSSSVVHVVDAVVHPEHLAAAREFARDREPQALLAEGNHLGHDRAAVGRRRGEAADVAQAEHGHVQRARDRRGAEREHVRREPELEQPLLVLDPEALLLVHDDQAEVAEGHVLRQQPVRTDDDVDLAGRDRGEDRTGLGVALEAAQALDAERIGAEPVAEGPLVLLAEHRRGHEHRHLAPRVDGLERSADRDLGLPEADVAAHEPVHRPRTLHVALGGLDRAQLVLGLLPRELRLELALPVGVGREGDAGRRVAHGLHAEHLGGEVAHRVLRIGDLALPALAADGRERRLACSRTHVLLHERDLADRHVQHRAAVELQGEELDVAAVATAVLDRRQAVVARDPMVAVHDVVAGLQVQERLAGARRHARPRAAPARTEAVHEFRLRHDDQPAGAITEGETAVQVTQAEPHALAPRRRGKQFPRALLLTVAVRDEPRVGMQRLLGEHREGGAGIVGEDAEGADRRLDRLLGAGARAEGTQRERGPCPARHLAQHLVQRHEAASVGSTVGEGAALLREFAELDEDAGPGAWHEGGDAHAIGERCRRLLGGQERRRDDRAVGGLRRHIHLVQPFEVIAEEVEPDGHRAAESEHIEQPPTHRELAGLLGDRHARVAGLPEPRNERCLAHALA
ncbi:MAG: hypothetical protein RL461_1094, partial [Planctomycetota bacterium]